MFEMDARLANPRPPLGNAAMDIEALGPRASLDLGPGAAAAADEANGGGIKLPRRAAGGDASSNGARFSRLDGPAPKEGTDDIDKDSDVLPRPAVDEGSPSIPPALIEASKRLLEPGARLPRDFF
jgi:hypothetical protein